MLGKMVPFSQAQGSESFTLKGVQESTRSQVAGMNVSESHFQRLVPEQRFSNSSTQRPCEHRWWPHPVASEATVRLGIPEPACITGSQERLSCCSRDPTLRVSFFLSWRKKTQYGHVNASEDGKPHLTHLPSTAVSSLTNNIHLKSF